MASHAPAYRATPLELLLASVPSLPRPILARLTARMIERLDEMDGDPDDEPDEDRCPAGDDEMTAGDVPAYGGNCPGWLVSKTASHSVARFRSAT